MNRKAFKILKEHYKFALLLILFIIAKIASLYAPQDMWWDSSVYIGMGKYIYSLGKVGLWEASRPLVWPLLLGFLWKLGLDVIFFGKVLAIAFSVGIVILTYLIALRTTNGEIALLASLFLAAFPSFFVFNNILFTEMPSTFFLLLGIYCFLQNKPKPAGFFMGVAFMTRFFHIFFLIPIIASQAISACKSGKKKHSLKHARDFYLFFIIPVVPFLLLNIYLYKNPFFPFALQAFMTKNTGWIYHNPFSFYFVNMIIENFLVIFSLLGIYAAIKSRSSGQRFVLIAFLAIFSLYVLEKHKEMRLLIPVLPFLFILTAIGLLQFTSLFRKNKNVALVLLLVLFSYMTLPQLRFDSYEDNLDFFHDYAEKIKSDDGLWISNPSFILHTDKRAGELAYYPLYDSGKARMLLSKTDSAKTVIINTCDLLPCPPHDANCKNETTRLLADLDKKMRLVKSDARGDCKHLIFEKPIS